MFRVLSFRILSFRGLSCKVSRGDVKDTNEQQDSQIKGSGRFRVLGIL